MLRLPAFFKRGHADGSTPSTPARPVARAPADLNAHVIAMIQRECPSFSAKDMNTPFERLSIDSVGLLMVRAHVEETVGNGISHRQWESIATAADIVATLRKAARDGTQDHTEAASERRDYTLNMPQMALGGLSESWLFKELGDMHWSLLAHGLGMPSGMLKDGSGQRIYATFTRVQVSATVPLARFGENEAIQFESRMSRYGTGIFFSEAAAKAEGKSIDAKLMSTFSKFGDSASNTSLLKGLPEIPSDCNIPPLSELPEFGRAYRARRDETLPPAIFECEYEILPPYDINGVGLLYFAAYPIINDICAARHVGKSFMTDFSTLGRDVFYFGNSNADDVLVYRLHDWNDRNDVAAMWGSISRRSDGTVIAHVATQKARL
jgi:probable biosynthetic protein (TIGR04098 family)